MTSAFASPTSHTTPPLASAHPTYSAAACRLAGLPSAPSPGDRFPMLSHTRSVRPLTPIFSPSAVATNISDGSYAFIQNLLTLEVASAPTTTPAARPLGFLPEKEWDPVLKILPDPQLAAFLRRGIRDGWKFRLIVNLSFRSGHSINDAISPAHSSFRYVTLRQVTELIPQGSSLAKIDLKAAFRRVPVHPADQHYLGISWRDRTLCDRALPFGLRSAPIIFDAVADGLAWAMICSNIVDLAHYLDDFIFWSANHVTCQHSLDLTIRTATRLGLPVEPAKVEGPSTTLTFLGIKIDTVSMELRLPQSKLARLKSTLAEWCNKKSASKHDLQVVIGLLCDAAQGSLPGGPSSGA